MWRPSVLAIMMIMVLVMLMMLMVMMTMRAIFSIIAIMMVYKYEPTLLAVAFQISGSVTETKTVLVEMTKVPLFVMRQGGTNGFENTFSKIGKIENL